MSLTKGLEVGTNLRMSELVQEMCPVARAGEVRDARGAEHRQGDRAEDAGGDGDRVHGRKLAERLQEIIHQPYFRVYTNNDVIGSELGGAIKNIVAIAAGITDTMGFGDNAMAALMTRGLAELTRLGTRLGGQPLTFAGLPGWAT